MTREELEQRVKETYNDWLLAITNNQDEEIIYILKCTYEIAEDDLENFIELNN